MNSRLRLAHVLGSQLRRNFVQPRVATLRQGEVSPQAVQNVFCVNLNQFVRAFASASKGTPTPGTKKPDEKAADAARSSSSSESDSDSSSDSDEEGVRVRSTFLDRHLDHFLQILTPTHAGRVAFLETEDADAPQRDRHQQGRDCLLGRFRDVGSAVRNSG